MLVTLTAVALAAQLQPLAPLVGHCWRAELPGGLRDTHCFEDFYDGRFVRDRHEVTGGSRTLSGETIYAWEPALGHVGFTYYESDGAVLRGSMTPREALLDFGEIVERGPQGELRIATTWVLADGSYDARWVSNDPRFTRTMHYVRVD